MHHLNFLMKKQYLNSYYEKFTIEELYENRYYGDFGFHYTFMGEYMWEVSKDLWSKREALLKKQLKLLSML